MKEYEKLTRIVKENIRSRDNEEPDDTRSEIALEVLGVGCHIAFSSRSQHC